MRVATQYASAPASWQYLRIYSPGGISSGMLAFKTSATSWPFDLESGVRVMCDVGYLCANFSLPRPDCYRVRPNVRDRQTSDVRCQTDRRQTKTSLNASALWGGGINMLPCILQLKRRRYYGSMSVFVSPITGEMRVLSTLNGFDCLPFLIIRIRENIHVFFR